MVSYYIPAIAREVALAGSAEEAYRRLRNRGYLSVRALLSRSQVITVMQDAWDNFPQPADFGRERSRDVVAALRQRGYVSFLGLTWGGRPRTRRPGSSAWTRPSRHPRSGLADIIVADYDPDWPLRFERLRSSIWPSVEDIATTIEHVGSTAVPGLAAKPIIDIDVVVPDPAVEAGLARLAALGYGHQGDLGVPGREAFRSPDGSPAHHLYLCPATSPALADHLAVRDYLRRHPQAASAYGDLKKKLAREFAEDRGGYVAGKTDFLVQILRASGR